MMRLGNEEIEREVIETIGKYYTRRGDHRGAVELRGRVAR